MTSKRIILIIDDEAPMRYLLERQLCRSGYTVLEAADGFAGVSMALAHAPDLIVLDLLMPGIDGFEVFRRLRSNTKTSSIPVIFLSGSVNTEMRRRAFGMGAADVLAKPHQVTDLVSVIDGIFRRQAAQSEPPQKGRIVSLFALTSGQTATSMAVYLSRMVALNTTWPVLLIDLDMAFSPIASRLSLQRAPHVLDLLEQAPVPMTSNEVSPYVQPQHIGLGVITAPDQPIEVDFASLPRLRAALDELRTLGYYVVIHLGNELTDLALSAMRGSDLVCAMTSQTNDDGQYASFVSTVAEHGVDAARVTPIVGDLTDLGSYPQPGQSPIQTPRRAAGKKPATPPRNVSQPTLDVFL
ncbi:MAG: response regulator [Chloroflexota bacterium]